MTARPRPSHADTPWGGQRGALLPADRQVEGTRIVTEDGKHGVITSRPGYSIHWGGVPLDGGQTAILLDSGVTDLVSTPTLYAEARRPDPARIEPGLPYLSSDYRAPARPDRRMSPLQLYRALLSAPDTLRYTILPEQIQHVRSGMQATLNPLLRWVEDHPGHPERAEMSDRALTRLRYEVYGTPDAFAARELAILQALRVDWLRDYRVGDTVRVLDERTTDYNPGWTLSRIDGEHGTVSRAQQSRRVPLWRLQVNRAAPRPPLPDDRPASLHALLEDNLAHPYAHRYDAGRFGTLLAKEMRAFLPGVLRTWLAEQGLDVAVKRHGDRYTLQSKRRAFTAAESAQVRRLLPSAQWGADGGEFYYQPDFGASDAYRGDLQVAPEHAERLSMLVSEALRAQGFRTSRVGEERRVEAAKACQTLDFELPGHGRIRVDCGDPEDPAAWHNLFIKDRRYAWGAGQWLKGKVPPLAVLEAVRQRGIRVFG